MPATEVHVDAMDIGDFPDNSFYWKHMRARSGKRGGAGYVTYDAGVARLTNGRFAFPSGIHGVDGRFLVESNLMLAEKFPSPTAVPDAISLWRRRARPVPDGVLLTIALSRNYYHWLIEILPRVLLLDDVFDGSRLPLYVAADLPPFVKESLDAAGLGNRVVTLPAGVYEASNLVVPTLLSPAGRPAPAAIEWVRQAIMPTRRVLAPSERLVVSRRDAKERHVLNEDEILSELEPAGFRRVILGELPFAEQVRLFASAEAVIGGHGAGFANAIFSQPGTAVLEIVTRRHWGVGITLATKLAGVRKGVIQAEDVDGHLRVDPAHVRRAVEYALKGSDEATAL